MLSKRILLWHPLLLLQHRLLKVTMLPYNSFFLLIRRNYWIRIHLFSLKFQTITNSKPSKSRKSCQISWHLTARLHRLSTSKFRSWTAGIKWSNKVLTSSSCQRQRLTRGSESGMGHRIRVISADFKRNPQRTSTLLQPWLQLQISRNRFFKKDRSISQQRAWLSLQNSLFVLMLQKDRRQMLTNLKARHLLLALLRQSLKTCK